MSESTDETAGMATGSDAGAPGDHLPDPPLAEDERALLDALQQPADGDPVIAVEDSPQMVRAAEDDSPLPPSVTGSGPDGEAESDDDPETPRFEAPGE